MLLSNYKNINTLYAKEILWINFFWNLFMAHDCIYVQYLLLF